MSKEIFVKRLALAGLIGSLALLAGCTHRGNAPVRDARARVPVTTGSSAQQAVQPGGHVVRQGETLYAISRRYVVSVQDLAAWNNLSRP